MFKGLAFAVENIGNDFSLVHMVLNTFDFLIILMTFACKYDNISVLGIVHAIFNCISAVRHDNILAVGFARPVLMSSMMSITSSNLELSSVITERSESLPEVSPIS